MTQLFTDADVRRLLPPAHARHVVERFLRDESAQSQVRTTAGAPPRLVVGIGASDGLSGFRAYREGDVDEAVTVAWADSTGSVAAVVVGDALGEIRTAALGAVALQVCVGPPAPDVVTVLGAGRQAVAHVEQMSSLWPGTRFLIHARSDAGVAGLVSAMRERGVDCAAGRTPASSLRASTVAVLATNSRTPVVDRADLARVRHVTAIGPKSSHAHELPTDHARGRQLLSDSTAQLRSYPGGCVIDPDAHPVLDLAALVRGRQRLVADGTPTTYVSVGRTGTELALVAALVQHGCHPPLEELIRCAPS